MLKTIDCMESVNVHYVSTLSNNRRRDISRHYEKHQGEIEEKQKLVPCSELRIEFLVKKKRIRKRRNLCSMFGNAPCILRNRLGIG